MTRRDGSAPDKIPTGIPGFDELSAGGLPRRRTTLVVGGPGTGKSLFAIQCLVHLARESDQRAALVAFEEPVEQIFSNVASFGWDLQGLQEDGRVAFVDAQLPAEVLRAGEFDVEGLLATLSARCEQTGAETVVLDAVDVLLSNLEDPSAQRRELYRIHEWLQGRGLTGLVTAKESTRGSFSPWQADLMQYMADCVVKLSGDVVDGTALRWLQVAKYRGSGHGADQAPLIIGDRGLEVLETGVPNLEYPASGERVSSGVEPLDDMLGGGYFRGSSALVSGSPGTAKTSLAGAFAAAACGRGEPTLYVSFDEAASQIVRNLVSIGIDVQPHLDSGLLRIESFRAAAVNVNEHVAAIRRCMEEHGARCMVIDPISALVARAEGHAAAAASLQLLITLAKRQTITLVITSLLEGTGTQESTQADISTVADTWIHLAYMVQAGERNRALTIVKSRGMAHSNQVRELVLHDDGIRLTDVYTAGGEVLMGTMRWEREEQERIDALEREHDIVRRRHEAEIAVAEAQTRISSLQREVELREDEIQRIAEARREVRRIREERVQGIRRRRQGDGGDSGDDGDGLDGEGRSGRPGAGGEDD